MSRGGGRGSRCRQDRAERRGAAGPELGAARGMLGIPSAVRRPFGCLSRGEGGFLLLAALRAVCDQMSSANAQLCQHQPVHGQGFIIIVIISFPPTWLRYGHPLLDSPPPSPGLLSWMNLSTSRQKAAMLKQKNRNIQFKLSQESG